MYCVLSRDTTCLSFIVLNKTKTFFLKYFHYFEQHTKNTNMFIENSFIVLNSIRFFENCVNNNEF